VQKKVTTVGNSVALVLDKPICDLLGIRRDSMVRLTTDGRRLIVEPLDEQIGPPPVSASLLDALPVLTALTDEFMMTREQFSRLHHGGQSMGAYRGWLRYGFADEASSTELATIQRLEACLRSLRSGGSWDASIDAALAVVPMG
jgi:hypothetical protein